MMNRLCSHQAQPLARKNLIDSCWSSNMLLIGWCHMFELLFTTTDVSLQKFWTKPLNSHGLVVLWPLYQLFEAVAVNGGTESSLRNLWRKRSSSVFRRWTKVLRVWNDIRVSKWWQKFHFWVKYHLTVQLESIHVTQALHLWKILHSHIVLTVEQHLLVFKADRYRF